MERLRRIHRTNPAPDVHGYGHLGLNNARSFDSFFGCHDIGTTDWQQSDIRLDRFHFGDHVNVAGAGYPEYKYSTGQQLVEVGHVYTIEPGLMVEGYGYIGLEENVLVTQNGVEYFCPPQRELILIRGVA